jgi:hypothetical protein
MDARQLLSVELLADPSGFVVVPIFSVSVIVSAIT